MIEEALLNYGVLGLWTATLLYERYRTQKQMIIVLKKNTDAINKLLKKIK